MVNGKLLLLSGLLVLSLAGCAAEPAKQEVVVYTSVDQVVAEPVLKAFEAQSGIAVRAVYDIEAAKTTGLVNRILAEKDMPKADVFWSSEFAQTLRLKEAGVLAAYAPEAAKDIPAAYRDPEGYWTGFAGRARVILINTEKMTGKQPASVYDLMDADIGGSNAGIPYPLFGTANTHAAALYAKLGQAEGRKLYEGIAAANVRVVDGNSVVRDLVAEGQLGWGITDTDDAAGAVKAGKQVRIVFPDQGGVGTLVVPNTAALIAGGPDAEAGKKLLEYLTSAETEQKLADMAFCHIPVRASVKPPNGIPVEGLKTIDVTYQAIYRQLDAVNTDMKVLFIR